MSYQLPRRPHHPQLVAHRGNAGPSPENTRLALEEAIELGVDMIEVDVNLSRDRIPVLIHHPTLDRTTNGNGRVDDHSVADLKQLDAGMWKDSRFAGQRLLTLDEGLELARDRVSVNLDLKTPAAISPTIIAVSKMGMVDQVVITGCVGDCAEAVRNVDTNLTVLLEHDPPAELAARMLSDSVAQAEQCGAAGLNINHLLVDEEVVEEVHRHGLSVWAWTVDEEDRIAELAAIGVDSITTNWPERMLRRLGRRPARRRAS